MTLEYLRGNPRRLCARLCKVGGFWLCGVLLSCWQRYFAKSVFIGRHWRQTWKSKMGEVKALWCLVVNLLQSKCFSHPFRHLGVISGDLEFPDQSCKRLSCVFWKMTTFIIWRILIKLRMTTMPSLPAYERSNGLFMCVLFTLTFPFLQRSQSLEDHYSE